MEIRVVWSEKINARFLSFKSIHYSISFWCSTKRWRRHFQTEKMQTFKLGRSIRMAQVSPKTQSGDEETEKWRAREPGPTNQRCIRDRLKTVKRRSCRKSHAAPTPRLLIRQYRSPAFFLYRGAFLRKQEKYLLALFLYKQFFSFHITAHLVSEETKN